MRFALLALFLAACTTEPVVQEPPCILDSAFDCGALFADGTGKYYFKLTNTVGIDVNDLSVQVNSQQCTVEQPSLTTTTLLKDASVTVPFSCSKTTGFRGDILVQYRIISPYAGEPIRMARGTINYENA